MSFIKSGGSSSQFLKANGGVLDSDLMAKKVAKTLVYTVDSTATLNGVSIKTATNNSAKIYAYSIDGLAYGVSFEGYINKSVFPNKQAAIVSSASIIPSEYWPLYYVSTNTTIPLINIVHANGSNKGNSCQQLFIRSDGKLIANGENTVGLMSNTSTNPYYRDATYINFFGTWLIQPKSI